MPNAASRYLILAALLSVGALAFSVVRPPATASAHWPDDDAVFMADGWIASQQTVERYNGTQYVSRHYVSPTQEARFVISTSTSPKGLYRAGPEIPFLGSGYTVEPAAQSLLPDGAPAAYVVRGDGASYLLYYAYGERRGLLGNGAVGWAAVVADAILGNSNDYYLMSVLAPVDPDDAHTAADTAKLAGALFPRVAAWYAAAQAD
jgi:hypothetical protein